MPTRIKILSIVLGFFALIIVAFSLYSSAVTKNYKQMRLENIEKTVEFETEKVNKTIFEIDRAALFFADGGFASFNNKSKFLGEYLARSFFNHLESAVGSGFWFEPYSFDKNTLRAGVYVFKEPESGEIKIEDSVFVQDYDYVSSNWYQEVITAVKKPREVVWTRPYVDNSGTFALMTTAGAGIFDSAKKLIGISTVDWRIAEVIERLSEIKPTNGSFVILCAPEKDYVISNTFTMSSAGTKISELSWDINADNFELNGVKYISFKKIMDNGWLLSVQIPEKEIFAEIEDRNRLFWAVAIVFCLIIVVFGVSVEELWKYLK